MRYAEDLAVGMEFPFGTWTLSEADIIEFARVYDPQPLHIDRDAAAAGPFGGIIASSAHTTAIWTRFIGDALWSQAAAKGGTEVRVRLRRPVRAGATLTGKMTITDLTLRPERGDAVFQMRSLVIDDHQVVVAEIDAEAVLWMLPAARPE